MCATSPTVTNVVQTFRVTFKQNMLSSQNMKYIIISSSSIPSTDGNLNATDNISDCDCGSMESEIPTMPPQAHETLRSRRRTRRPQRFGEYLIEESDDKNESGMNCSMV